MSVYERSCENDEKKNCAKKIIYLNYAIIQSKKNKRERFQN